MNRRAFNATLSACILTLAAAVPAAAQDEDLGSLVNKGLIAMNAQKWEEALLLHTQAIERYGRNQPLVLFGPQFGNIWYRRGICELRLGQYGAAMQSFETCYRDFPNKGHAGGGNTFEKMALLRWGEAAMGAENWALAITQFQKFLKERDPERDKFPQGTFYISLAIAHYNLGKIPEGNENLEIAIRNKETFPTANRDIVAGFQALVNAAITARDEQALVDFINRNRGSIIIEPFAMQEFSAIFMKLAGEAVGAEMFRSALELYQLVPGTDHAIEDIRARIRSIDPLTVDVRDGPRVFNKPRLEKDLAALESERRSKRANEMIKLAAIAFLHGHHGNIRGAFAAYLQLETHYPQSEAREDNLFQLIRTAAIVAPGAETQKYGETFLKTFPESPHVPAVRRMLLSSLFADGEYETCIEVAEPMLPNLEPGTEEHDICLHVLGGSYYFTGQYDRAKPLLDEHVEKYPKSLFAIPAAYFQASNVTRLQFWKEAARLLDSFLSAHPDPSNNAYLAWALYDRATTHFAEDEPEEALKHLTRIISEFPDSPVIDQAYNLHGNVHQSLGNRDEAEESYLKALEIAERRKNHIIAGESVYSLVALLGEAKIDNAENPRLADAVPWADRYWAEFAEGSPYQARVAVAQVPSLTAADRGDEALERLQRVISEIARQPEAAGLEELINSHTDFFLERHTPDELKDLYYNFPGIRFEDRAARALLRVALIGVFESVLKKAQDDPAVQNSASAMIGVLFRELKSDFALKDLTNFILVKVGDFLRNATATPREALPYYEEVLGRQDQSYRFEALLGSADIHGQSGNAADLDKALEAFRRVYADSQVKNQREFALYRIVELLMQKGDYAGAEKEARVYLDRATTGFSRYSPRVGLLLAESFDKRNDIDNALALYTMVWGAHPGNIAISAPAMRRWMELMWQRNKPAAGPGAADDRQGAYNGGAQWIENTSRFKDKMTESDRELWNEVEKLVKTYEANPNIKSLEQQRKEKEAELRRRR